MNQQEREPDAFRRGSGVQCVDTIANMRGTVERFGLSPAAGPVAVLEGYSTPGDGGGGLFVWVANSVTDNGGTTIVPCLNSVCRPFGCWKRVFDGALNVRWFGAKGDGVTNDYAAIVTTIAAAVEAGGAVVYFAPTGSQYVCTGTVQVPGNIRLAGPIATDQTVTAGAVIYFKGAGSGFQLEANVFDTQISNLLLLTDSAAGPAIGCVNGAILSSITLTNVKILLGNPAAGGIALGSYANPCGVEPMVIDSVKITAANGQYAPLIGMWGTGGALSNITFAGRSVLTNPTVANAGTPLGGTVSVTDGNPTVTFSQEQTLLAGQLIQFSAQAGVLYEVKTATNASTSATLTQNYFGTTNLSATAKLFAEMIHIESVDNNAIDNLDLSGIIFEIPYAGAIKLRSARNSAINTCWMGDLSPTPPIGHLIWLGKSSAAGSPPVVNIAISNLNSDSGVENAATVYTGNDESTQAIIVEYSTVPFIQNVPTGGPYTANQGYVPIEFDGSLLGAYAGDPPVGTDADVYRCDWARALPPDTVTCTNGLNSSIQSGSGLPRSRYRVTGPTASFSVDSIAVPLLTPQSVDGFELELYNPTSQYMTLVDVSTATGGASSQRIQVCNGGANIEIAGPGYARLTYDLTAANWALGATSPDAAAFNPSRVTSAPLVAWWDANLRVTIATGVSSWVDSQQGRALVQATGSSQPAWSATSGPNNLPAITFTAGDTQSLQGQCFSYSQAMTVFIVCKWNSSAASGTILDGATIGNHARFFRTGSTDVAIYAGAQVTDPTETPQSFHVFMIVFNGSSSSIITDGLVQAGPSNAGANNANGITVGAFGDGLSDPADAIVSEILIYEGVLSATDESRAGRYLAKKYDIGGSW